MTVKKTEKRSIMKVVCRLSAKSNIDGNAEILLSSNRRTAEGKVITLRAKSEIFVSPSYFDDGSIIDLSSKRIVSPDILYHREQKERLDSLLKHINVQYQSADKNAVQGDWLKDVVERFQHPDRFIEKQKTFYDYVLDYVKDTDATADRVQYMEGVCRTISRYEGFVRSTDGSRSDFSFDIDKIDGDTLSDFTDYLKAEKSLSYEYPDLFERLQASYPDNFRLTTKLQGIMNRGNNTVSKYMRNLKFFWNWLLKKEYCTNNPFRNYQMPKEIYGSPFYLTVEERNQIAEAEMPTKYLEVQRDIFLFQCWTGCRVSDLITLTDKHISNGELVYIPKKTRMKKEPSVAEVPLSEQALAIIEKYKGVDRYGRLLPFTTPVHYNKAIREIVKAANIDRYVTVRNSLTGKDELRPLWEVSTSHMARRTFVGNAYAIVQDPALICKMSGHVEHSQSFSRYRKVQKEALVNVISKLG